MENSYGVGIQNRYALFLGDEDPFDILKAKEKEREAKKKKNQSAEKENKGVKKEATKTKTPTTNGIKDTQNLKSETKSKDEPKPKKTEKVKFVDEKKPQEFNSKDNETDNKQALSNKDNEDNREKRYNGETRGYRGDRDREPREPREPREYREPREPREPRGEDGERFGGRNGSRGGPRGGRGRGGRSGDFRKRDFDRQSGSDRGGIKPTTKRNGAGQHNWGTDRDEFEDQIAKVENNGSAEGWGDVSLNETVTEENGEKKDEAAPVATTTENTEAAEEVKEITLDEWKATRGVKILKPQYNLRKAGEGEDTAQWKNMYVMQKKEPAADQAVEVEKVAEPPSNKTFKKKEIVDTNFHFADPPMRGGRGKGGRGGRGGRGGDRFRDRGPRDRRDFASKNKSDVDVNSVQDFPRLG